MSYQSIYSYAVSRKESGKSIGDGTKINFPPLDLSKI
jgi:hypothetical protein